MKNVPLRAFSDKPWRLVLAAGLVLTAVDLFVLPHGSLSQAVFNNAIAFAFTCAIVVGIRLNRPADQLTWWLLALGSSFSIAADSVSTAYIAMNAELPFPSFADVLYLAAYPCLFVAVARLGRGAVTYRARERRLDAVIIALGVLVLSWEPLLGPYVHDSTLTVLGKLTLIAYPIMDIAVLYILLCAVVFNGRRATAHVFVGLAMSVVLFGDFAYDILELHGAYTSGDLVDATWLLNYLLLGVAALHPSMANASRGEVLVAPRAWWLMMVAMASFVPPTYLLVGTLLHADINVAVFASLALGMAVLGAIRMTWMFQALRERAQELEARSASLQESLHERSRLEDDLRHQAFHDPLTGLANRALLADRVEQSLLRSDRDGSLIALIMCDLDGFKTVNDSLGHQVGDELLVTAAQRLTSVVRPGDTVARLGGDEFAILLDRIPDAALANQIAERIVAVLREPAEVGDDAIAVSASVGVSFATSGRTVDELVGDADAAMYDAKTNGRNRFEIFEPSMRSRVVERLRVTSAFAGSIARGEFHLDYQPCFALGDGRLRNFEALVRWDHPSLGVLAPMRFIPLAEETGFILPLGRWILETACAEAASWPAAPDSTPTIAVNVSAVQLRDRSFVETVADVLESTGLPGHRLVLEVTESMLIVDRETTIGILEELKAMGIRIAIDDFGVGYSSLSQLRELPVDFVKIDKSFVDQLGDGTGEGSLMIEAVLQLAQGLDLTTVAEGIEDSSQCQTLTQMGCDSGQGFLLSRPLDHLAARALASGQSALAIGA